MKLTAKLAYSQIKTNRSRSVWTLLGIILATAMITAVFGFAASGHVVMMEAAGGNRFYIDIYESMLAGLGAFFSSIIVAASVVVVSNSFRVSAGERIAQFGILKSVGATKKQITETILFEGVLLCTIAIPAGILLGMLVHAAGIGIVNYFLTGINELNENPLVLHFVFAWQVVILATALSFFTVLLSAWLPARKAAKIPAITAIRGVGEVVINPKQTRGGQFAGRLFGFEGVLAAKSRKRSRRNFRATVLSLTVSITLFIVVGAFGMQMNAVNESFFPGSDATVVGQFYSRPNLTSLSSDSGNRITEELRRYPNTTVFGVGYDFNTYSTEIPREMMTEKMREAQDDPDADYGVPPVTFIITDEENYAMLCGRANVPLGSNILVNQYIWYQDGGRTVIVPYEFDHQTLKLNRLDDGTMLDLPLHGSLLAQDLPGEILFANGGSLVVIVPKAEVVSYLWFASPAEKEGFMTHASAVLNAMLPEKSENEIIIDVMDVETVEDAQKSISNLIQVFVYGFVTMLTLIGLTNVVSTISTNIRSRTREFAVLQSVGMTPGGLNRMLNYESLLCSVKALVYGIPLGVIGSYLTFISLENPVEFVYKVPWTPIIQCTVGVFIITWGIMRYAAAQLRGGSLVEKIRFEGTL